METESDAPLDADHYVQVGLDARQNQDDSRASADGIPSKPAEQPILQKLACDHCRSRKVACDRCDPCSRCVRQRIPCEYTTQPRPRPKGSRRPPNRQYEAKIDELSRKLDSVCQLLEHGGRRESSKRDSPSPFRVPGPPTSNSDLAPTPSSATAVEPAQPEYEGGSALSAHTAFATNVLKAVLGQNAASLHETSPVQSFQNQVAGIPDLPVPSAHLAFDCLRLLKEDPRMQLPWVLAMESIEQYQEYFLKVYTSSHPSAADQIIVLACAAQLFPVCAMGKGPFKNEYEAEALLCHSSLEIAIARLPFHLPATFNIALALTLAADYSLHKFRVSMAWNLTGAAARMSQALGFHKACMQNPERYSSSRRQSRLYIMIYMMDKMLSLRLGRTAMVREEELPLDLRTVLQGVNTAPCKIPFYWTAFCEAQGLVYDRLYSPRALQQSDEVRNTIARDLLQKVRDLDAAPDPLRKDFEASLALSSGDQLSDLLLRGDRVGQLAFECLIYHASAPKHRGNAFYMESIPIAREALREYAECIDLLAGFDSAIKELYIQMALLASPFVPFIIILCNVVETHDLADLELLGSMTRSIEGFRGLSPEVTRHLGLFKPLYDVAGSYIKSKAASASTMTDFGAFLGDSDMDLTFGSALVSTFAQHGTMDGTPGGEQAHVGSSILDAWREMDYEQLEFVP